MQAAVKVRAERAKTISNTGLWMGLVLLGALLGPVADAGAGLLEVSWTAPVTNANGTPLTDLAGYRVYLGTSTPACPGSSYHAVASSTSTPGANQTVRATITGLNAGTTYWMRITAVDQSGNQSACTSAVSGVARGSLSVSPTGTVAFGSLLLGLFLDRTFTVQNTSGSSLSGTASVGAPFSIVSGGSFTLAGGASQPVVVRFRPTSLGSFVGNVNFTAGGDTISRGVSGSATGSSTASPTLSISRTGSGSGTVTSSPSGISCGSDCTQTYTAGTRVTLTASAASGSTFGGWSGGGCSGTGTCSVTLNATMSVTATFNSSSTTPRLTITRAGSGTGTVTSSPSGISCGSDCTQTYTSGTRVTLTASAASGSTFAGWSGGGCSGTGTCAVTVSGAIGVTATFNSGTSTSRPDLIVTSLSIPSTVYRTSGFSIKFNVVNQGSVAAGTTRLTIYLTRDIALSSGNVLLRVLSVASIPAGGTISNAITQTLPSGTGTGTYYIFLIADQGRQVAESNETNNTVKRAITVR
jgi:hypothetical protein